MNVSFASAAVLGGKTAAEDASLIMYDYSSKDGPYLGWEGQSEPLDAHPDRAVLAKKLANANRADHRSMYEDWLKERDGLSVFSFWLLDEVNYNSLANDPFPNDNRRLLKNPQLQKHQTTSKKLFERVKRIRERVRHGIEKSVHADFVDIVQNLIFNKLLRFLPQHRPESASDVWKYLADAVNQTAPPDDKELVVSTKIAAEGLAVTAPPSLVEQIAMYRSAVCGRLTAPQAIFAVVNELAKTINSRKAGLRKFPPDSPR